MAEDQPGPPDAASQEKTARTKKTLLGMLWSVGAGIGSRFISLVSTLLVTRFIDPTSYGEVSVAYIVTLLAHLVAALAIATYVATRPKATKEELFHAAVIFHVAGIVALALVYVLRDPLGSVFGGKNIEPYILGYIAATFLDRVALIPEAMLIRDERFRTSGLVNSGGEVLYAVLVLVLAARGMGGHSIVYAGIARSAFRAAMMLSATNAREWTTPCKWDWAVARGIFRFGLPMMAAQLSGITSRRGDNLAFSRLFGLGRMGAYNLAYNLADVPASTVGERIGDVLVPSFAKLPPEERPAALARSIAGIGFAVFPLSAGICGISRPLSLIFNEQWRALDIQWMLAVLAFLPVGRSIEWAARVYLQVAGSGRTIMTIEWVKVVGIMTAIFGLGLAGRMHSERIGAIGACVAVVGTFFTSMMVYLFTIARREGVPFSLFAGAMRKPGLCAGLMCAGVVSADRLLVAPATAAWKPGVTGIRALDGWILPHWDAAAGVLFGVLLGAGLYTALAYLIAGAEVRELIRVMRSRKKPVEQEGM